MTSAADSKCPNGTVNLFLVGAAKAGTSSLWASLRAHPDIFGARDPIDKEPGYFSAISDHMGIGWYHGLYADSVGYRYRLDASTAYLTDPDSAARIQAYCPKARIVIVLRDPTARAYSLYNWMVGDGYEAAPNFEAALALEDARFADPQAHEAGMPQYFWNYMYRRSGLYCEQVARYTERFPGQVLLVNFADLAADPAGVHRRILDFLDLPDKALPVERENSSRRVFHPGLSFAARRLERRLTPRLPSRLTASKARRDMLVTLCQSRRRPPRLATETRAKLDRIFAPELDALKTSFGMDLTEPAILTERIT